jgi:hypothetical protein
MSFSFSWLRSRSPGSRSASIGSSRRSPTARLWVERLEARELLNGKALILAPTVTGGASSREAQEAIAQGLSVDVVDNAGWAALTQAQFASYQVLILGDPTCSADPSTISAAVANENVWGPVVNGPGGGNVIVIGTDPVYHATFGNNSAGAAALIKAGIDFSLGQTGKTGLYLDLSCYYASTPSGTAVPIMDVFGKGAFTVHGPACTDSGHVVSTGLPGITDADLSMWECSVHEAFQTFTPDFTVFAIDENAGSSYTAPDGTKGDPYILVRGAGVSVISNIDLEPPSFTLNVGVTDTLTATVTTNTPSPGTPVVGTTVTFNVISGPNAGKTGTGVTNSSGQATFSYTSSVTGTDFVNAMFVDSTGKTETSGNVTVTWTASMATPPVVTCIAISPVAGAPFSGAVASFTDADGGAIGSYTATIDWGDGTTTTGAITANTGGGFNISGNHTYASHGSFLMVVQVKDTDGTSGKATCNVIASTAGQFSSPSQNATINFWASGHGQALIDSFNGGSTSTALATWLATSFPNLYGASGGSNNLTGKTNADVAALFLKFYAESRPKPDAQALTLALDVYATTSSLGGTAGMAYFNVTATGLGATYFNIGTNGAAFDAPNNVAILVYDMLVEANKHAVGGVLYSGNSALLQEFLNVVVALNDTGRNS